MLAIAGSFTRFCSLPHRHSSPLTGSFPRRFRQASPISFSSCLRSPPFEGSSISTSHQARAMATNGGTEPDGVPRSVRVDSANKLLQAGHQYLDVRTSEEFSAGHAVGAANIPYMFKTSTGMTKNPSFLKQVSSVFQKDDKIVVGCQSGRRSLMAATDLKSVGFTCITDLAGGYAAWVENGLPTEK